VDVRASGSKRFAEQDIVRASGIEKGQRSVSLERVKEAAANLLALGIFIEVSYRHSAVPGGMKVEFAVKDSADFVPADFDNIVWLSQPELLAELHKRVPLFSGDLPINITGNLTEVVASALQSLLNERGIKSTVSFAPAGAREGLVDFYIFRADDVEVKIAELRIADASPAFLPQLHLASKGILGTHYQRSSLQNFIAHNLINVYQRAGYLRAEFAPPQVAIGSVKENETLVNVTLPVREGRPYTFVGFGWSGNATATAAELDPLIHLRVGKPVDGVQLASDLQQLRTEYARRGFMHMLLKLTPEYDDAAGTVRYEAAIKEGDHFNMGKLDIAGLQPSSEDRVRQKWRMREGDPYDPGYVKTFFANHFRLPPGVSYVVEQSEGEAPNSIDLTLVFCKAGTKCLASAPNQLYIPIPDDEPRPRRK
ncbi:MAG TPA: hypothetical protein VMZ25_09475, partial [Terriglobales bacterium]|nr:hypothetical protein [Terriglobales bacterium]